MRWEQFPVLLVAVFQETGVSPRRVKYPALWPATKPASHLQSLPVVRLDRFVWGVWLVAERHARNSSDYVLRHVCVKDVMNVLRLPFEGKEQQVRL